MKSPLSKLILLAIALLLPTLLPSLLQAQDVASITGTVTDGTGAVIANATVMLKSTATGATYTGVTNATGSYLIANVPPGPGYEATISATGFKSTVVSNIYMNVDASRTQNVKLAVGAVSDSVTISVANEGVTLNTTDASIGNNFEVEFLNDLPIANRDSPSALFTQQPGVTLDGAVTGARVDQNNVTVDGLEVNDNATGGFGAIVANAPVDSVQEFRGVTAGPLSSAGQGGGGQFELVTRGGTNHFHGALVEYHRDTDLEANDWFNNNQGLARPALIRNQFGGNFGGPAWRNRLFFFFDYNGRRDTLNSQVERTVPLDSYRAGNVSYVTDEGNIATLTGPQVTALDPLHLGFNPAVQQIFADRFPEPNDFSGAAGDLVNTAGFRFNAPNPYKEDDYVQRVDFNLTDKMRIWGRGTFTRTSGIQSNIQFPGDPLTAPFYDQSYAYVVGHDWTIGSNKVNRASYGETFENYQFPVVYNPQGQDQFSFSGLSGAYHGGSNTQLRTYAIPIVRDDFNWDKGKHSLQFGGTFKWETPDEFAAENFNFDSVGTTGNTPLANLTADQRPSDISGDATQIFDSAFTTALGTFATVNSNFNYTNTGAVKTQGTGLDLKYRYYETEVYAGDTWKVTPHFTVSYGVRYQNYTVPYETRGSQSISNTTFDDYFKSRMVQSAAGLSGDNALPFISYTLGGKANNAKGYYQPDNKGFAPRLAFAYNPEGGKTVFSAGAGLIYDHTIINALQFQQLQSSYLFEASNVNQFGSSNSAEALANNPRFGGITNPAAPPAPPSVATPFTPFVDDGTPVGLPEGEFNTIIDPKLKTPYSLQFNAGFQHEFPQGYILKVNYVGRLGRRLLAEADAAQLVDFPDNTGGSNQSMSQAMGAMTTQLRANSNLSAVDDIFALGPQPWFEDMVAPGIGQEFGFDNNTQFVAYETFPYPQRGDFADMLYLLSVFGVIDSNVGMSSQFSSNTFWTNKGSSNYNGMLVTLHKNAGYGLQFDLNYTWSHSIDNVSFGANNIAGGVGYGFICDIVRPRECRGNSDFDVSNYINGNFIYALPFGRGRSIGTTAPMWANEIIGGWSLSGLPSWHTGNAYNASSNAFVAGFANNAPATLIGSIGALKAKVHAAAGGGVNAFSDRAAALAVLTGPTGFAIGSRNNLRGPGYFNLDLGLGKSFPVYEDKVTLKFRADAFNVMNHPSFGIPFGGTGSTDITEASGTPFGTITSTASAPRVLQLALRLEF